MSSQNLVESICGRGWDHPFEPDPGHVAAVLAESSFTPPDIFVAAAVGDIAAVQRFLAQDDAAANTPGGPRAWSPLLYAAYSFAHRLEGREDAIVEVVRVLLEAGADPDTHYFAEGHDNGFSALYGTIAVSNHRPRTLMLLKHGANPSDGNSTFHAVESFDLPLLVALCEAGIERDDASYAIKHAIDMRWDDAVRLLLDHGADPNATHPAGDETTLHWAVIRGASRQVIAWLLEKGADIEAQTRDGRAGVLPILGGTAYDFARRLGHLDAMALLEEASGPTSSDDTEQTAPSPEEALVFATARGDATAVQRLMAAHDGLLDRLPVEDRALLPHWAQHGRTAAVSLGLSVGWSAVGTAWLGLTAVHWAALRGDVELLQVLLDVGAPVVDLGGYFGTPLHTATHCHWYAGGEYEAVAKVLKARTDSN